MFDPWRELGRLGNISLVYVRLPGNRSAMTNGVDMIWLDDRLTRREKRCALTHELVHIEWGHTSCQTRKVELKVRRVAAQRLVRFNQLVSALPWARGLDELAEELMVTRAVLRDRIEFLTPKQREIIATLGHDH